MFVLKTFCSYTLWNAEYRLSLAKNFEKSSVLMGKTVEDNSSCHSNREEIHGNGFEEKAVTLENSEVPNPAALSYIHQLEAELAACEKVIFQPLVTSLAFGF